MKVNQRIISYTYELIVNFSLFFKSQALALTRPKTPPMLKKDDSCSSPSSLRQTHSEHQRSPTRENSLSRQSSKTPVNLTSSSGDHRENNSTSEVTTANNSNANSSSKMSSSSPISLSEKSNHQNENISSNGINSNNGNGNNNHRDQFSMNGPEKILPSPSTDRKDFEFSKVNGEYITFGLYFSYYSKKNLYLSRVASTTTTTKSLSVKLDMF